MVEVQSQAEEPILLEANLLSRFVYLSESGHMCFWVEPELSWFSTDIVYPNYLFNTVLRANFATPEEAHSFIQGLLEDTQARQAALYWFVGPASQPAGLGEYLEGSQFERVLELHGMKLALAELNESLPSPAGFTIRRVETLSQLREFVTLQAHNSNIPPNVAEAWFELEAGLGVGDNLPWQRYVGFWRGEPVAACSTVAGAGVIGLYQVATLPQARGRGLATAIVLSALREARQQGHTSAVLHSTPLAVNIYRQLGFRPVANLGMYRWSS